MQLYIERTDIPPDYFCKRLNEIKSKVDLRVLLASHSAPFAGMQCELTEFWWKKSDWNERTKNLVKLYPRTTIRLKPFVQCPGLNGNEDKIRWYRRSWVILLQLFNELLQCGWSDFVNAILAVIWLTFHLRTTCLFLREEFSLCMLLSHFKRILPSGFWRFN